MVESQSLGNMVVPVFVQGNVVKAIADTTGKIPVTIGEITVPVEVTIHASDITVPVSEQSPLTVLDVHITSCPITLPVQEQSPLASIQAQAYGYDGASWRKNALQWGYSDSIVDQQTNNDAAAGNVNLDHTTVPTGEVWVITNWLVYNSATATRVFLYVRRSSVSVAVRDITALTIGSYTDFSGQGFVVKSGDILRATFLGCSLHDVLVSNLFGYSMKVTM